METEKEIDYFEYYDQLPFGIQCIINEFNEVVDEGECDLYEVCADLVQELEQEGWTCDYGLDGEPHSLKPIDGEYDIQIKQDTTLAKQPKALM